MTDTLSSLAYVSRCALPGTPPEVEAAIAAILASARHTNQRLGITGALLFTEGTFAQVLEGPRAAVEEVFETIQCDTRHTAVTLLHFHPLEARSFAGWDMAYAGTDAAHPEAGQVALPAGGQGFVEVLRDRIHRADAAGKVPAPGAGEGAALPRPHPPHLI